MWSTAKSMRQAFCAHRGGAHTAKRRSLRASAKAASTLPGGVVRNASTRPTPRLTAEKVYERLFEVVADDAYHHTRAFYSSELGGIITEPALMMMHCNDPAVQHAYMIEEQARLMNGYVFDLAHIVERLLACAESGGIGTVEVNDVVMRVVLDTCAASKVMDGFVRVWMGPGRRQGSPALYVTVTTDETQADRTEGLTVVTSPIPPRALPQLRLAASASDTLCTIEANQRGAHTGIYVDSEGYIVDSPGASVGVVTGDNILVTPPSEDVLLTASMELLLELAPQCDEDDGITIVSSEQRPIHVSELEGCSEVFLTSTLLGVLPVVEWDGVPIGPDGTPGINALAMEGLLNDAYERSGSPLHFEVPYGYLTGMREQLR